MTKQVSISYLVATPKRYPVASFSDRDRAAAFCRHRRAQGIRTRLLHVRTVITDIEVD